MSDPKDITLIDSEGREHEVKGAPLTVICSNDNIDDLVPKDGQNTAVISPQDTVKYIDEFITEEVWTELGPYVNTVFKMIFNGKHKLPMEIDSLRKRSLAEKHVAGLIFLTYLAIVEQKIPFIQLPETYLHPSFQVNLATWLTQMANGSVPEPDLDRDVQ
jgi:hypothetical protein